MRVKSQTSTPWRRRRGRSGGGGGVEGTLVGGILLVVDQDRVREQQPVLLIHLVEDGRSPGELWETVEKDDEGGRGAK